MTNSLGNQLLQFSKLKCTVQDKNQHCDDPCCNETKLLRIKGSQKNFIHTRNADLGVFLYQNKPLMVTYICALTELYNIYKHIYRKNNNKKINCCASLIIIFFLFITDHIFLRLLACFVIIICFSLSRRFTFLKAKKNKNK